MARILKCTSCGTYTLKNKCPACNAVTRDPTPPKYSPVDRWGAYRRKAKLAKIKEA